MGRRRWYRLQRGEDEARTGLTVRRKQEAVFYLRCQSLLLLSPQVVSNSITTLWPVAHQASLSLGFPRQEYWSGLLHKPMCPALAGGFFTTEPPGSPRCQYRTSKGAILGTGAAGCTRQSSKTGIRAETQI